MSLFLTALGIAGAGAIAGVGANAIFGGGAGSSSNPTTTTNEAPYRNYSPTYSPTNVNTDSRSFADSRILNYSPSVIIESPNATISKKEALTSQAQATSTPEVYTSPTTTGGKFDEERNASSSAGLNPMVILGGALILGGAYFLTNRK